MPKPDDSFVFAEIEERYNRLFALREDIMKALEIARAEKRIGKSLDAKLTVYAGGEEKALLEAFRDELAAICIVSAVALSEDEAPASAYRSENGTVAVLVEPADGERCERCWIFTTDITDDGEGRICRRCKKIVE